MATDETDNQTVSDELMSILTNVKGIGNKKVRSFSAAGYHDVEDFENKGPFEIEHDVDGVGITLALRLFDKLDAEGYTNYTSISTEIDTDGSSEEFANYFKPLINQANRTAHSTRPKRVGQVSEWFDTEEFDSIEEWKTWYIETEHTDGLDEELQGKTGEELITEAANQTWEMLQKFKRALEDIDPETVRRWTEELVLIKTPEGLINEKLALEYLADKYNMELSDSSPDEESKGIDGYIGDTPISIKSSTYDADGQRKANEAIEHDIINYHVEEQDGEEKDQLFIIYNQDDLDLTPAE